MVWDVEAEGFGSLGSSPGAGCRRELRQPLPRETIQEHLAEVMDVLVWFRFFLSALDDFSVGPVLICSLL